MTGLKGSLVLVFFCVFCCLFSAIVGDQEEENTPGLQLQFYRKSCPTAEQVVKEHVGKSVVFDPSTAAALLRLAFHDCQVDGCDGSVLLRFPNGMVTEEVSDKNFGLRKLNVINGIKSYLETICPQTVSCADIIQLAARDGVYLAGGPYIEILTGRKDGKVARKERADKQLPPADISVEKFIEIFQQKNITLQEGVALIGAHTLGIGHCRNFEKRLQPPEDQTLATSFKLALLVICSNPLLSDVSFATNDGTSFLFDNRYFIDILNGGGLLKIDSEISRDKRTQPYVAAFASDQQQFFNSFTSGFIKLSNYKVLLGEKGEIRKDCRFVNDS